jgi:hypothetical protein
MSLLPAHSSQLFLPDRFPEHTPTPKFGFGNRVYWQPLSSTDFGVITGVEYAPAEHLQSWAWRYVVWLDPQSPSCAWTHTDEAWEEDLELQPLESASGLEEVDE